MHSSNFIDANRPELKDTYILWLSGLDYTYEGHTVLTKSKALTITIEFIDGRFNDLILRTYYHTLNIKETAHINGNSFEIMDRQSINSP